MALDVGDRRIGVAISDPSGLIASTLEPLDRAAPYYSTDLVIRLAIKNDVAEILVGMPLLLSGKEGSQADKAWKFVTELEGMSEIPVRPIDERLSTVEARRLLRHSPGRRRAADKIDSVAAAVVLQSYLDSRHETCR